MTTVQENKKEIETKRDAMIERVEVVPVENFFFRLYRPSP